MSSKTQEQEIKQRSLFSLTFGITYWMAVQGVTAFAALRDYAEHRYGLMWFSILLLALATTMLSYKLEKWRTL